MIQELKDAFTITLAKRLSSPLLSTLMLSGCVANYDILLLIFSSNDWNTKVTYINGVYGFNYDFYLGFLPFPDTFPYGRVLWPLGISLFYIGAWPWFDMKFYSISKTWSIRYKKTQMKLEGETPISQEERKDLEDKYINKIDLARKEISEKEARISELEERNKTSSARIVELKNSRKEYEQGSSRLEEDNKYLKEETSELQAKINLLSAAISSDEKANATAKNKAAEKGKDVTPETQGKKYEYIYKITDAVRKIASRKGSPLGKSLAVSFNREDLPKEIFDILHDLNYNSNEGKMSTYGMLKIDRLANSLGGVFAEVKSEWTLDRDPTDLDNVAILQNWFDEYTESTEIIEKEKSKLGLENRLADIVKITKSALIPVKDQRLADIATATELPIKGQTLAEMDKEITVVKPYRAKEKLVKRLCDFGLKRHDAATLAELSPKEPMELKRILIAYQVNGISDKAEEIARIIAEEEADRFAETVTARKKEKLEDRLLDAGISVINTKEIANWASMGSDMTDISIEALIESDLVSGFDEAKIVVTIIAGVESDFLGRGPFK